MKKSHNFLLLLLVLITLLFSLSSCAITDKVDLLPGKYVFFSKYAPPKVENWAGNVFQIVTYGADNEPLSCGTGVIVKPDGTFITNAHVLEGAVFAQAIFEIDDEYSGTPYTYLDIITSKALDPNKDLFVGMVKDYVTIVDHFKEIKFTNTVSQGDTTYSIGYPNALPKMEIHKGKATEDLTSLYDKLKKGSAYIGSTSYIAPGSSGGILVNNRGEIIGITSRGTEDDNGNFIVGASILYKSFKNEINSQTWQPLLNAIYGSDLPYVNALINLHKQYTVSSDNGYIAKVGRTYRDWGYYDMEISMSEITSSSLTVIISANVYEDDGTSICHLLTFVWSKQSHSLTEGVYFGLLNYPSKTIGGKTYNPVETYTANCKYSTNASGQSSVSRYNAKLDLNSDAKALGYSENIDEDYYNGWFDTLVYYLDTLF